MRYIRQLGEWSCAPVCIMNAMKWSGQHVTTKKDFHRISKTCGYVPRTGTGPPLIEINKAIKRYLAKQYAVRRIRNVKIGELAEHVSHVDRSAMLIYVLPDATNLHMVFVENYDPDEKIFNIINFEGADKTYASIPRDVVVEIRKTFVWLLRKR